MLVEGGVPIAYAPRNLGRVCAGEQQQQKVVVLVLFLEENRNKAILTT